MTLIQNVWGVPWGVWHQDPSSAVGCRMDGWSVGLGSRQFGGWFVLGLFVYWAPCAAGCGALDVTVPFYCGQHLTSVSKLHCIVFFVGRSDWTG